MPALPRMTVGADETSPFALTSLDLCRWYVPIRGLGCSLFGHGIALILLVVLFPSVPRPTPPEYPLDSASKDDGEFRMVIYLPSIGGGRRGGGGGLQAPSRQPRAAPGAGDKGIVHPGPQPIRSDSNQPTSRVQTLLQPDLEDPPILRRPVNLPNLISLPKVGVAAPIKPREQTARKTPTLPKPQQPETPSEEAASRLAQRDLQNLPIRRRTTDTPNVLPRPEVAPLPQSDTEIPPVGLADLDNPETQLPIDPSAGGTKEPLQAQIQDVPIARRSQDLPNLLPQGEIGLARPPSDASQPAETGGQPSLTFEALNVVSLSPMPAARGEAVTIPIGEARGRFSISPNPNTAGTEPGSLSASAGQDSSGGRVGDNVVGESPAIITITFGEPGGTGGTGSGAGTGTGSGAGPGTGTGLGSGSGTGAGEGGPLSGIVTIGGFGGDSASGSPTGSGSGDAPLARITTIGGFGGTETAADPVTDTQTPRPLRKRYELFVLSTEKGGGGLPYFGVFSDEQIRTVYLDMREGETDAEPLWILEFGVPREIAILADPSRELDETQPGFVLPFPAVKAKPAVSPELVSAYVGEMVIVYALISPEGKMEQMSVKASPDPVLNELFIETLKKWVFRPGVLNGEPVAVKVLLGIPLWATAPPG